MLVGAYPTSDEGHGLVSIVCTTLSLLVSITDTVSLFVLATNSVLPAGPFFFPAPRGFSWTYIAVGCRPTSTDPTGADGFAVSITLTVPVVDVPRYPSAGTWVP